MNHSERCQKEATRDVIFIFQRRQVVCTNESGYEYDSDLEMLVDSDGMPHTDDMLLRKGDACIFWEPVGVWLDRDEAEAWGEAHHYNFGKGRKNRDWRVYGMPSEGRLAELLKSEVAA